MGPEKAGERVMMMIPLQEPSINDVTCLLKEEGDLLKSVVTPIRLSSKMGDKGEGGVKNHKKYG